LRAPLGRPRSAIAGSAFVPASIPEVCGRAGPTHVSGKPFIDVGSGRIPCRPGVRHSAAVTSSRPSHKPA
jgi:hypothetical protein